MSRRATPAASTPRPRSASIRPTYALTSEGIRIGNIHGDAAGWALDALNVTVRVRAARPDDAPVFVGIASQADVDRFLAQTAHEEITDVHGAIPPNWTSRTRSA